MAEKNHPQMLFANFNQDFSCISVGTRKGYSITNCDPFGRVYTMNDGPRSIVEMLFCTSLLALVGAGGSPSSGTGTNREGSSPRKLEIVNTKRKSLICELLFPSTILAVKMNRKTLVIVLETEIYVYDISNMRLLHVVETVSNPDAICALSPNQENSYLAYPSPLPHDSSSSTQPAPQTPAPTTPAGAILLLSTRSLTVANLIHAHRSPLALLSINSSGTMVASASVKGTIIRVHAIPSGQKLYQFRRGTRETRICSMNFNSVSSLLAVSSSSGSGTVHVFKLSTGKEASAARNSNNGSSSPADSVDSEAPGGEGFQDLLDGKKKGLGYSSSLRKRSLQMTKSLSGYLPTAVTEMWEPQRDFAWLKLPPTAGSGAPRYVVGMSGTTPQVMVLSSDGYFYAYNIDLENGGECGLMKQYSLIDSGEERD